MLVPLCLWSPGLEVVEDQDLFQVSERQGQNLNLSHGDRSWADHRRFIFKKTFRNHIHEWKIAQINNRNVFYPFSVGIS